MTALFTQLVLVSLVGGVLIAAVLLLRLAARRAPRWVMPVLWGLAALRLCCPFFIESPFSPFSAVAPYSAPVVTAPVQTDTVPVDTDTSVPAVDAVVNTPTDAAPAPVTEPTTPIITPAPSVDWAGIAAWVWVAGMAVMAGGALFSWRRLRRQIAVSVPHTDGVRLCDAIDSPFVLGLRRPTIYLPFSLNEADAPYVLAHERTHIRRRDPLWKLFGYLLLTVYWFQPLVWVGYRVFCRDLDLACDERATAPLTPAARGDYARALLTCATKPHLLRCPLAFGEVGVKQRVKAVLTHRKPLVWVAILLLVVGIVAAAVLLLVPPISHNGVTAGRYHGDFGVSLSLVDADLTPGQQSLTVRWAARLPGVRHGLPFSIEKKVDGEWEKLPMTENTAFFLPSYSLPFGTSTDMPYSISFYYGDLPDGEYRLVTHFSRGGDHNRPATLSFTVCNPPLPTDGTVTLSLAGVNPTPGQQCISVQWHNQSGRAQTDIQDYFLKQESADGWTTIDTGEIYTTAEYIHLGNGGTAVYDYDLEHDYGTLPNGNYLFCTWYKDAKGKKQEVTLPFTISTDQPTTDGTVTLSLRSITTESGQVCLSVRWQNQTSRKLALTEGYHLQKLEADEWHTVAQNASTARNITFNSGIDTVLPHTLDTLTAPLPAGTYRFIPHYQDLFGNPGSATLTFTVPEESPLPTDFAASARKAVDVSVSKVVSAAREQTLTLSIRNSTDQTVVYGEAFSLYRQTADGLKKVTRADGTQPAFKGIAYLVEPQNSGTHTCRISDAWGHQPAGKYLLVFAYTYGEGTVNQSIGFTIT